MSSTPVTFLLISDTGPMGITSNEAVRNAAKAASVNLDLEPSAPERCKGHRSPEFLRKFKPPAEGC